MADNASGSGAGPSKAIGSLAKKPSDVTRQGTQKFKFTPVLPARRQKKECVILCPLEHGLIPHIEKGRGRGAAPRAPIEMTASGPFAMGPSMAGNNARRSVPRSNFAIPTPTTDRASLGAGLTRLSDATLKRENDLKGKEKDKPPEDEEEVYSDPDEGVEIIDMDDVRQMDWMAPESLRKERRSAKKKKIKKEEPAEMEVDDAPVAEVEVDAANALDLSESEEEEEFEDLIEHFARQENVNEEVHSNFARVSRSYISQDPVFARREDSISSNSRVRSLPLSRRKPAIPEVVPEPPAEVAEPPAKRVSFADDTKPGSLPGSARGSMAPPETVPVKVEENPVIDGIIGTLEVYRSGAVKMRLQNGILLDVTAATQPSFLQHAVCLDLPQKRLTILGEVNKRFVVSPDIDTLLTAMEVSERRNPALLKGDEEVVCL
ncbi:RNA polymerase III RPC4-domain-containing protein [Mycena metata]|uniref:RNA polymerase III RPC4-domain-containing protein n=1 Tax=Mycena metata TaxID=1033252 RepID=A0AAD7JAF8_9AGAR|nr:RNA polymerase III RPC4-domain-containing protein [Mycena metata]